MRVFKAQYRDKQGRVRYSSRWYVDFSDHASIQQRIPAFTDKKQSAKLSQQIEKLVSSRIAGQPPDRELTIWLENVPAKLTDKLSAIGLLSRERAAGGKSLLEHLDDFKACLRARGNTEQHTKLVTGRARKVIIDCRFVSWSNISASKLPRYLAGLQEGEKGISNQTFNFYLQAVKQFCRWMVQNRRASENPLEHLTGLNTRTDRRHDRQAPKPDEIRRLLETTRSAPERFGMTGPQRAVLYRLAAESGLRAGELSP